MNYNVYEELMDLRTSYDHAELIKRLGGTTKVARALNNEAGKEKYTRQAVNYWQKVSKIPDSAFFEHPDVWLALVPETKD